MADHQSLIERLEKRMPTVSIGNVIVGAADLRDTIAALKSAPDWHDAPTGPGFWLVPGFSSRTLQKYYVDDISDKWPYGKVYGPIPGDSHVG